MVSWGRSRRWLGYLASASALALTLQGCQLLAEHYPSPPKPLRPTTIGVIASVDADAKGWTAHLADGRTVLEPDNGTYKLLGGGDTKGWLLLAGETDGGFAAGLAPLAKYGYPGCWEAWTAPSSDRIAWDQGDSILFMTGIELPKATGYQVNFAPHDVDGRLAWTSPRGDAAPQWMSFCANERGEIEWGRA